MYCTLTQCLPLSLHTILLRTDLKIKQKQLCRADVSDAPHADPACIHETVKSLQRLLPEALLTSLRCDGSAKTTLLLLDSSTVSPLLLWDAQCRQRLVAAAWGHWANADDGWQHQVTDMFSCLNF
jgi:hypothetical protein